MFTNSPRHPWNATGLVSVRPIRTALSGLAIVLGMSLPAMAAEPLAARQLSVVPQVATLQSQSDSQAIVAVVTYPDGSTRDVTLAADYTIADPKIVRIETGIIEPVTDGESDLVVRYEDLESTIRVRVAGSTHPAVPTFRNDVLPVLTRAGCNSGRCHGAASGKDGFRLSLFGYDPAGDQYRLTREHAGRRINLAQPDDCLLVNKALGRVPHTGGTRIEDGSREHHLLLDWLSRGAPPDPADTPTPVRLEVFPKQVVLGGPEQHQLVMVLAHYSDGSDRDVTDSAVFVSNNDAVATVTEHGLVSSTGPGTAFILARFDEFTEGAGIIVRPMKPFTNPEYPTTNYVDELVLRHWQRLHLSPSPPATDEVFLRRVYLDVLGVLPTLEEQRRFLDDPAPDKRERLVDTLLDRPEFLDLWVMKWAEQLQIRTVNGLSPKGLQIYDTWLRERIRSGATVSTVLREVLSASGGTFDNPATNYFQTETTPELLAENVAQAFLGMRLQCAQCHNHPFDRWTMSDYYGFANFFSQVGYKQAADPRELTIYNAGLGDLNHPVSKQPVPPKFLGGKSPALTSGIDRREPLAAWLTDRENQAFSRNIANLVWAHFFGIGIVEPVDDFRVSNPPSNPELLDGLAEKLSAYDFQLKPLVKDLCTSRTYQLSAERTPDNSWDERHFSHGRIRRLRAEILLDAIHQVTEAPADWPGLPPGSRAVHVADGRTADYFLTTFGRSSRNTACSCEVKTSPSLSQALHLLNGETTSASIVEGGVVERLLAETGDPLRVVDALYKRCLVRLPTDKERAVISTELQLATDPAIALADLFWALLNSNEFLFNH